MLSWDEFVEYFNNHGRCINDFAPRTQPMNERKLKKRYQAYVKSEEKRYQMNTRAQQTPIRTKIDEEWDQCVREVWRRDGARCQLSVLYGPTSEYFPDDMDVLDVAHVFGRGAFPYLKYDEDNLVLLSRIFHTRLDQRLHPYTGEYIGEDIEKWWRAIVGRKRYEKLGAKAYKKGKE